MTVAVCNIGELPVDAKDARLRPDFIVRVRTAGHLPKAGDTSLEAMGRAFMNADGAGNMADIYYGAIRELTLLYPVAGADQLMGYTMAHELGHLLIGAGHRPNGLMRAALSKKELDALKHRHLKFNEAEQAAILHKLRSRLDGFSLSCSAAPESTESGTLRDSCERGDQRIGTLFSFSTGLDPFLGADITILGSDLVGTDQSRSRAPRPRSPWPRGTLMTATVPDCATTGKIQVVTFGHKLPSNVPFGVLGKAVILSPEGITKYYRKGKATNWSGLQGQGRRSDAHASRSA
jgi:hypothetical protein